MKVLYTDDATSALLNDITNAQTTITLVAGGGAKFPTINSTGEAFFVSVEGAGVKERMRCTSRAGDVLTVVRGQSGTTAAPFVATSAVGLRVNAALLDSKVSRIAAGSVLQIFVRTTGNDTTGTGSTTAPYLTIAKALSTVRDLSTVGDAGTAEILLGVGTYVQTASLNIYTALGSSLRIRAEVAQTLSTTPSSATESGATRLVSTAYVLGKFVLPIAASIGAGDSSPCWWECTVAGTTDATAGGGLGGYNDGASIVDGTVTWSPRYHHDVTVLHPTTPTPPVFVVGRYLRNTGTTLFRGTHKVIAVGSGTVTYRVSDRGARAIEAAPAAGALVACNVVISNAVAGAVLIDQGRSGLGQSNVGLAQLSELVLDGAAAYGGSIGYRASEGSTLSAASVSLVNFSMGVSLPAGAVATVLDISACIEGVTANGAGARAYVNTVNGSYFGAQVQKGAVFEGAYMFGCGGNTAERYGGVYALLGGSAYVTEIANCLDGAILTGRSMAVVTTLRSCRTGVRVVNNSYAEVTTFTTNTSNILADGAVLAINTVGGFNSYVRN